MPIRRNAVVLAIAASMLLPGCLFGKAAVFTASGEVEVPDF